MKNSDRKKYLIVVLILLLATCILVGCQQSNKELPNNTDDGYSIISADGFTFSGLNSELSVPNLTTKFSFENKIKVSEGATWVLTLDNDGIKTILSKEISLNVGDNYVYIWVIKNNNNKKYTVNVHRNYIMTVQFYTNGGSPLPENQYVEEGGLITEPTSPEKSGYAFDNWNYDFTQPIPYFQSSSVLTISASWIGESFFSITNDGTISLTDYGKIQETIFIPEQINNIKVLSIGYKAFDSNSKIKSVVLPNTLKHIDGYAFYNCVNLTSINFPNSLVSIGEWAFCNDNKLNTYDFGNNLISIGSFAFYGTTPSIITIPENVISVGKDAFGNNSKLEVLNYNAINATAPSFLSFTRKTLNVTINIGENVEVVPVAFAFCDFSVNVAYNHNVTLNFLGNKVTTIGNRAFYNCKISNLKLPDSLAYIGEEAFLGSQGVYNQTLTIPENISYIGKKAFFYSQYGTINYNAKNAEIPGEIFGDDNRCSNQVILNIGQNVRLLPQNLFIFMDFFSNNSTQYFITDLNFHEYNIITELKDVVLCEQDYPHNAGDLSLKTITFSRNLILVDSNMFRYTEELEIIKYFGSAAEYDNILKGANNTYLTSAKKIFNYIP